MNSGRLSFSQSWCLRSVYTSRPTAQMLADCDRSFALLPLTPVPQQAGGDSRLGIMLPHAPSTLAEAPALKAAPRSVMVDRERYDSLCTVCVCPVT